MMYLNKASVLRCCFDLHQIMAEKK